MCEGRDGDVVWTGYMKKVLPVEKSGGGDVEGTRDGDGGGGGGGVDGAVAAAGASVRHWS